MRPGMSSGETMGSWPSCTATVSAPAGNGPLLPDPTSRSPPGPIAAMTISYGPSTGSTLSRVNTAWVPTTRRPMDPWG